MLWRIKELSGGHVVIAHRPAIEFTAADRRNHQSHLPALRQMEAAGGILLLVATAAALVWANSRWEHSYHQIWYTQATITLGQVSLSESRHEWVNDGFMSIFFFLVGLEIKRELLIGELSTFKQAAFPFMAAIGGSVVPALIYVAINKDGAGANGWGIPMATDIAFALGVLALLGSRVPVGLKVFVAALAIVDDIFGVLVIALFYTKHISLVALGFAFVGVAVSFAANWLGHTQSRCIRAHWGLRVGGGAQLRSACHHRRHPAGVYHSRPQLARQGGISFPKPLAARSI